jgi:cytoplasmic FMR1 interacting protein
MHDQVQIFTGLKLSEYYTSAVKKKKHCSIHLKYVNDTLLEDANTVSRSDPISPSQLHIAKAVLSIICDDRAKGMKGGLMKEKNFSSKDVAEIGKIIAYPEKFFKLTSVFKYMTNIHGSIRLTIGTVKRCSDLSNLWFKEFYLELSHRIQVYSLLKL